MGVYSERARDYFLEGYNCSQAVFMAFSDLTGVDKRTSALISSSFGGGMGRMREVCGAVSGMFMAAGILYGYESPEASHEKAEHYKRIQELAASFKERNGSIICRVLLGGTANENKTHIPDARTAEYYKKRPCAKIVEDAAEILEEYIKANPLN